MIVEFCCENVVCYGEDDCVYNNVIDVIIIV